MHFKKVLCLLAGVVIAFGANNVFAQASAAPNGVRVRITSPDSAKWAGIGQVVNVHVLRSQAQAPALDTVAVTLNKDTLGSIVTFGVTTQGLSGLAKFTKVITGLTTKDTALASGTGFGSGTSIDTFKFTFTVAVGDPESSFVIANAYVSTSTNDVSYHRLNNLNTTPISTIQGFNDPVGDKHFISIDGQRPVNGSIFTAALIDTIGQSKTAFGDGSGNVVYKIGDQVKLKADVQNFNAATARVGLYEISQLHADSSMYSKTFSALEVIQKAGKVRDSFNLASGQLTINGLKNNLRAKVVAYLVDNAGNLGANTATNPTAEGFSQNITYVFDSNAPTVTITYPDSTGKRFTGRTDTSLAFVRNDGTIPGDTHTLQPLKFKVNEGVLTRYAIAGKDTARYGQVTVTTDVSVVTTDSFSASKAKAGGASVDLNVVAIDSAGNKGSKSVTGVIHDAVAPAISGLFPASASLPENKINNITRHPIFQINEVADSISIRFVQVGSGTRDVATQAVSAAKLSVVGADIQMTVNDTLLNLEKYVFQVFIRDLAKNVNVTTKDTLTFDKAFNNPVADSFIVKEAEDSVLAGQGMKLTVTAIDSKLTRQAAATRSAVTYGKNGVLVRATASDISGIKFWGPGVTDNAGTGTANLNSGNWVLGVRDIWVSSTKAITGLAITVEDSSTTIVDGTATKVVNFKGTKSSLTVDEADMRKFMLVALEGGQAAAGVAGDFQVKVTPTDWWGNPSMKTYSTATAHSGADSLALLDTRLTGANSIRKLEEIFVEFGSNLGGAQVPSGAQSVMPAGSTFTVVAPPGDGTDLTVSVRTINVSGDSSGALKHLQATGSVTVSFSGSGVVVVGPGTVAAPANLVVQDYRGAAGTGDQGFYVMVSFPHSTSHSTVDNYRIWRELDVTTGLGTDGKVATVAANKQWVSWTTLDAVPAGETISRAVVPVTDNVATRWAVTAESGNNASAVVVAGKRVFTQESVKQMAQFFGVDPNRVVSPETLGEMFVPSSDYIKSIIGDQKGVQFGALSPDVASLVASGTVPNSIRTAGGNVSTSAQTVAAGAVAAVDNIAPAAVTGAKATGTTLSWTASVDDRPVGYINYQGFAIPIAGVTRYEVMGGTSQTSLALIATAPAGATGAAIATLPSFIRVDALDLDNRTVGTVFQGGQSKLWVKDASGATLYIVAANGSTPNTVDFEDFIAFAQAFNASTGSANFNTNADTNGDGFVNFPDFIAFAGVFGKTGVGPATKPVFGAPGVNENAEFSLNLGSDRVLVGETVTVDVSLANVQALVGYQFVLNYETDKFEFVGAAPAEQDLLTSTGGETPLFHSWSDKAGEVTVANAVINGSSVNGGGEIVSLTFRVLREFEDNARFEVANGLIADPNQLSNSAIVAGVLEIQSTPTEFALLQNFPNPFNPETTIQYNLTESADVTLHIYNVVGQVVRTLVSERQSAGRYRVQWSGMDDRSVPVSSGIYFYEIRAGKNKQVLKLMLLK
jgi:hypothetical protein